MVGGGGGSSTKSTIIVSIETGSTVGIYDSTYTTLIKSASEKTTGEYWLTGLNNGTYYIKATKDTDTATESYTITEYGVYRISMSYQPVPTFTYTGSYEIVDDAGNVLDESSESDMQTENWKIRFLTSGTLNFSKLGNAYNGIDVFLVGGGGGGILGGGGGGYTTTATDISITTGTDYSIAVGSGGTNTANSQGGTSSAFEQTANGGYAPATEKEGGTGGSGGGGYGLNVKGGNGGSDGSNGGAGSNTAGVGQGTTTREFGENSGTLYAGGGGGASTSSGGNAGDGGGGAGASSSNAANGATNTGGGGGGARSNYTPGTGGSGIVIMRNARS